MFKLFYLYQCTQIKLLYLQLYAIHKECDALFVAFTLLCDRYLLCNEPYAALIC